MYIKIISDGAEPKLFKQNKNLKLETEQNEINCR